MKILNISNRIDWCELINNCFLKDQIQRIINSPAGSIGNAMDEQDVRVRRYGEVVLNTLSTVKTVLEYPKGKEQ